MMTQQEIADRIGDGIFELNRLAIQCGKAGPALKARAEVIAAYFQELALDVVEPEWTGACQ